MSTVFGRVATWIGCLFVLVGLSAAPGKDPAPPKKLNAANAKAEPAEDKPAESKPATKQPVKEKEPAAPVPPSAAPAATLKTTPKSSAEIAALARQIRDARSSFTPAASAGLAQTQFVARNAARRLEAYLADMGEERDAWKSYLRWDALQAELEKKNGFDVAALAAIHRRLTAGYSGLELPPFRNLARAVDAFLIQAETADAKALQGDVEQTLAELATTVEAIGDGAATAEQASVLGAAVTRLARAGQAPEVVDAVTRRYSQPNLLVDVAETFVTDGETTSVDKIESIRDCILGTTIHGTGHTIGTLTFDFVEDPNVARIATYFQGTNFSKTVGTNRSALICSSGRTELSGSQILLVGDDGLHHHHIAAQAVVHNQITGIGSTKRGIMGKIVTKIASKKAPQQKGQAECIASAHAKRRLADQMKKESDRVIADANEELGRRLRDPLERFGAVPRLVKLSTTEDALLIRVLQEGPSRFAAPAVAPAPPGDAGIAVRVHRSLIENSAAQILAGRKFDDERIRDLAENQLGLTLKEKEDDAPFSITFADVDPISLSFEDDHFAVTVRGKAFTSDDKAYEGMNITARYKAETDGSRAKLVRQGDFEIVPPGFVSGRDKLSLSQTALKRLLERRFEKMFKAEYVGEGLTLEGELSKLGVLYVSKLQLNDDWATIGLDRRADQAGAE